MGTQLAMAPAQSGKVEGELNVSLREMLSILSQMEEPEDSDQAALFRDEVIGAVQQSISDKLRRYQKFFSFCDGMAEECGEEIARLQARKKALDNAKQRLRNYLAQCMDAHGIRKLDAGTVVFTLCAGKPSLMIRDEEAVPFDYKREEIVVTVDKAALKLALERGEAIEGAELRVGDPFVTVK